MPLPRCSSRSIVCRLNISRVAVGAGSMTTAGALPGRRTCSVSPTARDVQSRASGAGHGSRPRRSRSHGHIPWRADHAGERPLCVFDGRRRRRLPSCVADQHAVPVRPACALWISMNAGSRTPTARKRLSALPAADCLTGRASWRALLEPAHINSRSLNHVQITKSRNPAV